MRIGFGYDAHKLVEKRKLVLGGVVIKHKKGLLGHSDADVLVHAIIDSLVGALGEGSIGDFFPDTDIRYKGISSILLLERMAELLKEKGYEVTNIDSTIVCQEPRLAPYISQMKENVAKALNIETSHINIKGKTEEGMGFTGKKQGISAYAVSLLHKVVLP